MAEAQNVHRPPQPDSSHAAALAGRVRGTDGRPLVGAVVRSWSVLGMAIADDSGRFLLRGMPAGTSRFTVQRVGYAPLQFDAELTTDSTLFVDVHLEQVAVLGAVRTTANRRSAALVKTGFFDRQKHEPFGYFITPDQVALKVYASYVSQMLFDVPGIQITPKTLPPHPIDYNIAFPAMGAGFGAPTCKPNVFVDGVFTNLEADQAMDASNVYAIEVYKDAAFVPTEFQAPMRVDAACGSLVIWTKKYEAKRWER